MISRREFIKDIGILGFSLAAGGCAIQHFVDNSPSFKNRIPAASLEGKLDFVGEGDSRIPVLFLSGSPFQMGYEHGFLLGERIMNNIDLIYNTFSEKATKKFNFPNWIKKGGIKYALDRATEVMDPYVPADEKKEMEGLARGVFDCLVKKGRIG